MRKWALLLPGALRLAMAVQREPVVPVVRVLRRVITRDLVDGTQSRSGAGHGVAVPLIRRSQPAANLNIDGHCLVLGGAQGCGACNAPQFLEVHAPDDRRTRR